MNPQNKYTMKEWAELFTLCTQVEDLDDPQSPHYIEPADRVWDWLCEYSKAHDLPQPSGNDVKYLIEEALQFLEKFSENHIDNMYNR